MKAYIDKSALVAEIERLKTIYNDDENIHHIVKYNILVDILSFLGTLEVKEADLDNEIQNEIYNHFFDIDGIAIAGTSTYATVEDMVYVAKHFFELGFKAQKGEEE